MLIHIMIIGLRGFAEYSALWFVQAAFQDNDVFFKVLDKWKEEIFNNRKYLFGSGQEAGQFG
ncbi:MAG: hypothetical protein MZV64_64360 [Ignavibacteriales bacterium]|nr:hypothetical protein [Ignavibacteriales bacterium]